MTESILITDREASLLLSVSRSKFHVLVAAGRLRRIKLGRSARYLRSDVEAFAEQLAHEASQGEAWRPTPRQPS